MSTIEIVVEGQDVTNSVIFSSATFESQLGAVPGTFEFTVRDDHQVFAFEVGNEVTLDIDGVRYFGGYAMQVVRTFAFPAVDTTDLGEVRARQWILRGVDYNIHFDKRIIYNRVTPTSGIPAYSPSLTDLEVIQLMFASYLDYTDIGLDVTTYVEAVGDPTPSTTSTPTFVNPGTPWRRQMEDLSQFTGAIWYIDPNKNFHYQAVESTGVAWSFADKPNHSTTWGFREFEYVDDSTSVVNDALVWGGSPYGSTGASAVTIFARAYNNVSAAAVGRWQFAEKHFGEQGFFETTGAQARANVIVYGEAGASGPGLGDQSRGLQNPQKNVRLTWFNGQVPTPLIAGNVINVFLYTYGPPAIQLALPVRTITITFPTPDDVQFSAFLGIQTSDPWTLWKYLKKASTEPPSVSTITTSDGSEPSAVAGTRVCMTPNGSINSSNTVFTTAYPYTPNSLQVYLNGLIQRPGASYEYLESDPTAGEFTFDTAPITGDELWVCFYSAG